MVKQTQVGALAVAQILEKRQIRVVLEAQELSLFGKQTLTTI